MDVDDRGALERYLRELARCLAPLPPDERTEIVREAESHLLDRVETGVALRRALDDLGDAPGYARRFVEDHRVETALASGSAWRMLLAAGGLLGRGAAAFVGFFAFLVLFVLALALVATGLLKPLFPAEIGAWLHADGFSFGWTGDPGPGDRELLGWWMVPVGLVGGALVFLAARRLLAVFLGWLLRSGTR